MSGTACLYRIEVVGSEEFYVGSTAIFKQRMSSHLHQLRKGIHRNSRLQTLFNEGKELSFNMCGWGTRDEMYAAEKAVIADNLDNPHMLNVGLDVRGGDNLTRHPDRAEIVKRIIESIIRRYENMTPEERGRHSIRMSGEGNPMFGKTHSTPVRALLSEMHKGNTYRLGQKASRTTRLKMSEIAKARTGAKNPFFGKTHSEETRKKLSESNKGKLPTNSNSIEIDGVVYPSQSAAARALGTATATITFRLRSKNPKYAGYKVIKSGEE